MKTIAIMNLKGGTAKTVTAATMARCLAAEHDKQVVLIDADQQGNLSQYFGVTDTSHCGNTWRLMTEGPMYWSSFAVTAAPHLHLIPSGMELARVDLPNSGAKVTALESLRTFLAEDGADFLIIDLPPSLGVASQAALLAADEVIIPIRLDVFSTAGMAELTRQVDSMRSVNPRLRVAGILGTQYQRTAEEREIHRLLKLESGLPVFRALIRMSPPVPKSIAARESVLTYSPHCGASKDYRAFVREYLEGGGKRGL
ncbi:ParA family protein [uncultured Oscillibacter sp.]|uniref:ParA family protein n=1 Tax=uncultured Oscillibacter sp. TaxID=876091 RepID=UPI00260A6FFC|nr:ParA family protein [uncultured Oscillibacter sp.]